MQPPLPFEILRNTFKYLNRRGLLQCQLTSKEWYTASVELLYSDIVINSNEISSKYVRTILGSPRLGNYLKKINTGCLFQSPDMGRIWDETNLMNVLIHHCPNLIKLKSFEQDLVFWNQLSFAASHDGQLSQLQCLPECSSQNLEPYLYAALSFKASLTELSVYDKDSLYELDNMIIYQKLENEIHEFKNLQYISLEYDSQKRPLSYFDKMIDECPHLKALEITICPESMNRITLVEPGTIIKPRSSVSKLRCNWEMLDSEGQINYLMQKFPNLDIFGFSDIPQECYDYYQRNPCPGSVVIDFLRYISAIPKFDVSLPLKIQDLKKAWTKLIDMNDVYRDLSIGYCDDIDIVEGVMLEMKNTSLTTTFYVDTNVEARTELPSTEFLSELGSTLRSLTILYPLTPDNNMLIGMNDILHIITSCPALQKLKIYTPVPNLLSTDTTEIQHTQMKELSVTNIMHPVASIAFLEELSLKLPNIKRLELSYSRSYPSFNALIKKEPITVNMPSISLDQLVSFNRDQDNVILGDSFTVYIRLKTNTGVKFYIGNRFGLLEMSEESYNLPHKYASFDIICQSLKELVIRSDWFKKEEIKWTF
ncbi:hypothetical protein BD770DRAFT_382592 [Pilaira anomala]|nr:hypothetical protein BD770DRAFT_382592 [Pilaira anomala]